MIISKILEINNSQINDKRSIYNIEIIFADIRNLLCFCCILRNCITQFHCITQFCASKNSVIVRYNNIHPSVFSVTYTTYSVNGSQ